jgi:hypothetical protein
MVGALTGKRNSEKAPAAQHAPLRAASPKLSAINAAAQRLRVINFAANVDPN